VARFAESVGDGQGSRRTTEAGGSWRDRTVAATAGGSGYEGESFRSAPVSGECPVTTRTVSVMVFKTCWFVRIYGELDSMYGWRGKNDAARVGREQYYVRVPS